MELVDKFNWDDDRICLFSCDEKIWEVKRSEISVLIISEVLNGDNDTTIFTVVDINGKRYHLDMLGLPGKYHLQTYDFFREKYDLDKLKGDYQDTSVIFYPKDLRGKYPYNKSLFTWIIRFAFNAGSGMLNKEVKAYLNTLKI